jgi:hypothetical protein
MNQIEKAAPEKTAKTKPVHPCHICIDAKDTTENAKTSQRGQPKRGRVDINQERKNNSSVRATTNERRNMRIMPLNPCISTLYEPSPAGNIIPRAIVITRNTNIIGISDGFGGVHPRRRLSADEPFREMKTSRIRAGRLCIMDFEIVFSSRIRDVGSWPEKNLGNRRVIKTSNVMMYKDRRPFMRGF